MKTNQPIWQFIANLGDAIPMAHGGFFVYEDNTGIYSPECVLMTPKNDEDDPRDPDMTWEVRRFSADKCTFANGVLSDNKFHPDKPAWFADKIDALADTYGQTADEVRALFCSSDTCERAQAWRMIGEYFGYDNLDSYPHTLTRGEVFNKYRKECYGRKP